MKVAVIGLGKIGLPLAAQFADAGHQVVGVDINPSTVASINAGTEPFPGEKHLDDYLKRLVPKNLIATSDYGAAIPQAAAVVVVVPLFVDDDHLPDFAWMDSATQSIGQHLTRDTLVSYETTLPVGTTRNRWKPALEAESGLVEGRDFHLVFSPERVLTGRVFQDLRKYPKLIGGLSEAGAKQARVFYESVLTFDERPDLEQGNGVWDLGSAEASEFAKLAETTYRDVNIGLANQFALFAQKSGIDIGPVIAAANSQPYSHIHQPGVSVGGHCIPVYPHLYLSNDPDADIVRHSRAANAQMPERVVDMLASEIAVLEGKSVVVLGASYRGGVKETAFSGVFPLVSALAERGANASVVDPMYTASEISDLGLTPYSADDPCDAVILHTDHKEYYGVRSSDYPGATVIVNGRPQVPIGDDWPKAITVGRGTSPPSGT